MFQSFDQQSDASGTAQRLHNLREAMKAAGVDGFLVPRANEFQGEYVPPSAERLAYISGFTGSAGLAVITSKHAHLFVDGRYTLQAPQQVDQDHFEVLSLIDHTPSDWVADNLPGEMLGYDPWLHTVSMVERLKAALEKNGKQAMPVGNLIDLSWPDRPPAPAEPLSAHPVELAGEATSGKIARVRAKMAAHGADCLIINELDSIAWLLNMRGADIAHDPVALCWAAVPADGAVRLYINAQSVTSAVTKAWADTVICLPTDALLADLAEFAKQGQAVQLDPAFMADKIRDHVEANQGTVIRAANPCRAMKAVKNAAELSGMRAAHLADGVAMVRFLAWFDENAASADEISAAIQLESYRAEHPDLREISFDTISASGPNGAITHYRVTHDTNRPIDQNSLYLVDSGGQYLNGTTDITRTIAVGQPNDDMKRMFTLVLQGHIAVAAARFPKGTSGHQLDILARQPLWQEGFDYAHGTGHGVGAYLSVHEGPISISKRPSPALEPGMILSNEPGYYRADHWGIRVENLLVVTPAAGFSDGDQDMLGFENLTLCPIDKRLIDRQMLSDAEASWINRYHQLVREKLDPLLADHPQAQQWLAIATGEL